MNAKHLQRLRTNLATFLDDLLPDRLGNVARRRCAELYLRGLLLDGQRKSIEPMATRLQAIDASPRDYEQTLQQFVNQSPWDDRPVRDRLTHRVLATVGVGGWVIVDDTGFPKQGQHSVGVARQYTGTLGKVANCQVAVTLQYATEQEVFALDAALFLPPEWGNDPQRLAAASVPADIGHRPKWQLALSLLDRAKANGLSGIVLADSAYGDAIEFRQRLAEQNWPYCLGISSTATVLAADYDLGKAPPYRGRGPRPKRPAAIRSGLAACAVKAWAMARAKDFRRLTWRQGSKGKLASRFAAWRVRPASGLVAGKPPLPVCWLLVEWPEGEAEPTRYWFSNLPPEIGLRRLVQAAKARYWVEHSYKELKEELGLDHFEGRSWQGWQHHVTLVLLAYAFLVLRRRGRQKKRAARG